MEIKLLHPDAKMPKRAMATDAGFDFFSVKTITIMPFETLFIPSGVAINIDPGFVGIIIPRSSFRKKGALVLSIWDAHFTGEVAPLFTLISDKTPDNKKGRKIRPIIDCPSGACAN